VSLSALRKYRAWTFLRNYGPQIVMAVVCGYTVFTYRKLERGQDPSMEARSVKAEFEREYAAIRKRHDRSSRAKTSKLLNGAGRKDAFDAVVSLAMRAGKTVEGIREALAGNEDRDLAAFAERADIAKIITVEADYLRLKERAAQASDRHRMLREAYRGQVRLAKLEGVGAGIGIFVLMLVGGALDPVVKRKLDAFRRSRAEAARRSEREIRALERRSERARRSAKAAASASPAPLRSVSAPPESPLPVTSERRQPREKAADPMRELRGRLFAALEPALGASCGPAVAALTEVLDEQAAWRIADAPQRALEIIEESGGAADWPPELCAAVGKLHAARPEAEEDATPGDGGGLRGAPRPHDSLVLPDTVVTALARDGIAPEILRLALVSGLRLHSRKAAIGGKYFPVEAFRNNVLRALKGCDDAPEVAKRVEAFLYRCGVTTYYKEGGVVSLNLKDEVGQHNAPTETGRAILDAVVAWKTAFDRKRR
jgi:hypothetical protein